MPLHDRSTGASPTARRSFLQRLAGLSALFATGGAPALASAQGANDPWFATLTGKHKQVFDAPEVTPFSSVYAATYLMTMASTYNLKPGDANAVVVYRHGAMPLLLDDAIWAKYKIGALINVTDPATKAPSLRNIFYKPNAGEHPFPDGSIAKIAAMPGVILLACGAALQVLSARAAASAGVDAATAAKDWTAGVIPGVHIVPSGVLAVGRAQERGCGYCFAS